MLKRIRLLYKRHTELVAYLAVLGILAGFFCIRSYMKSSKSHGMPFAAINYAYQQETQPHSVYLGGHAWTRPGEESSLESLIALKDFITIKEVPVTENEGTLTFWVSEPPTEIEVVRFDEAWVGNNPSWEDGVAVEIDGKKREYVILDVVPGQVYVAKCFWGDDYIEYSWHVT